MQDPQTEFLSDLIGVATKTSVIKAITSTDHNLSQNNLALYPEQREKEYRNKEPIH